MLRAILHAGLAVAFAALIVGDAAADVAIGIDRGQAVLLIEGTIRPLDHCQAAIILADHPAIDRVLVNSPGGDAWAGAFLGRLFGWAQLEAVVPAGAGASSAAAVAVIGAPRRTIVGSLGLHRPYLPSRGVTALDRSALAAAIAEVTAVLESGGMPPAAIGRVMATRPENLMTISARAAAEFHHRGTADHTHVAAVATACRTALQQPPPPMAIEAASR